MNRPDYIVCIQRNHTEHQGKSWCGRSVAGEFAFTGLDHAAENNAQGGRLVACRKCLEAATPARLKAAWQAEALEGMPLKGCVDLQDAISLRDSCARVYRRQAEGE